MKKELRIFLAGYFWAAYVYPAILLLSSCVFHAHAAPLLWTMALSDAVATAATLQIAVRTEGRTVKDSVAEFFLSMYGAPLRYW